MPELPEVETIRRDIEPFVKKRAIRAVKVIRARNVLKDISERGIKRALEGKKIERVERRGKYLIFKFKTGDCLIIHLGMTGKILKKPDRFVKVEFKLNNGKSFYFSDIRMFGKVSYSRTYPVLKLGPEPLADDFTPARFAEMLRGRGGNVKSLLLNQRFLAGVGNIYALEVLFRAGISPRRKVPSLKPQEISGLYRSIRQVLTEGIDYRGTSVDSYVDSSGKKGGFQFRLKVYGRGGEPCFKCKTPIKRIVMGNRGTYFCPKCQR